MCFHINTSHTQHSPPLYHDMAITQPMLPGPVKYDSLTLLEKGVCVHACMEKENTECVYMYVFTAMTSVHPNVLVRLLVNFSLGQTLA